VFVEERIGKERGKGERERTGGGALDEDGVEVDFLSLGNAVKRRAVHHDLLDRPIRMISIQQ